MKMLTIATAVALIFGYTVADAKTATKGTIGDLLEACEILEASKQEGGPHPMGVYCFVYLVGVAEGHSMGAALGIPKWCMPTNATSNQRVAVFTNWAKEHPEKWHESRMVGVAAAFSEAWPC